MYANTNMCSPIVCGATYLRSPLVCGTTCLVTDGLVRAYRFWGRGDASGAVNAHPMGDLQKSLQGRYNYASSACWQVNCTGNNNQNDAGNGGAFSANGDCNRTCLGWDPWGRRSLIWNSYQNDTGSDADGGWNKTICCLDPSPTSKILASTILQYALSITFLLLKSPIIFISESS